MIQFWPQRFEIDHFSGTSHSAYTQEAGSEGCRYVALDRRGVSLNEMWLYVDGYICTQCYADTLSFSDALAVFYYTPNSQQATAI